MKPKHKLYVSVLVLLSVSSATFLLALAGKELVLHACRESNGFSDIPTSIEATGATFGYSSDSCRDLVAMVRGWDLLAWKNRIIKVKRECDGKTIATDQLAASEEEAAHFLYDHIREAIHSTDDFQCFELAPIIRTRKATCVGYSSLFYILGESIGLSIQVIEVRTDSRGRDMNHVACIVHLSDGTDIMADLIGGGFISKRFRFLDEFSKADDSYALRQENSPLHLHRRVKPLNEKQFASGLYRQRANWRAGDGRLAEALREVNKAIALDPESERAFRLRAIFNNQLGKYREAISDATRAIEINPRSDTAYKIRGSAYSRAGDDKQAVFDFSRSIEINPRFALAYAGRGHSMSRLGRFEEARRDFDKAVELDGSLKELVRMYSKQMP